MKNRTQVAAADLYVLLQKEFRRRQPDCNACYVQLPFRVDRSDGDAPNWEVIFPPDCPRGCREVLDEVVEEFGSLYDLRPEFSS